MEENKQTYFYLNLTSDYPFGKQEKQEINDCVDLVFTNMSVADEWYQFESKDDQNVSYLMKTISRKRAGQLKRICEKNLPFSKISSFTTKGLKKESFHNNIQRFKV